jgi:cyclopropane-fatty-acyl-phospholipid synthase
MKAIRDNASHVGLHIIDDLAFGPHYARTLAMSSARLTANAGRLGAPSFDEAFRRISTSERFEVQSIISATPAATF